MKTLILAAAAITGLAFPALAQDQTQPKPATTQQSQPMNQQAQSTNATQAGANMQGINPNTLSHQQIQQIQQALDKNGFGAGRVDGIWGPETQSALAKFQKSKNMGAANGQLDNETLSALQLNPDQFGQGAAANGGMNGANTNMNGAANNTNGANTGANSANGGMNGANGGANSAETTGGANPGAASKTTP
jgi:Putative peptidoglycan binding domain